MKSVSRLLSWILVAAFCSVLASALAAQQEVRTLRGHNTHVTSVAFSPDGKTIASGDAYVARPGKVILWDAQTGKLKQMLKGHDGNVTSVAFSPDGKTLASGSADETVKLWDVSGLR